MTSPAPQMIAMRTRLRLHAKPEASADVMVALEAILSIGGQDIVRPLDDVYVQDAELQRIAEARGRSTWDEDDICTALGCERGPQPTPPPPADPEPPDAAPGH